MLPALLVLCSGIGIGGIGLGIYKYLSKKNFILLDGVEMAGKTTLSRLLLGENMDVEYTRTTFSHIKKGNEYIVYDLPGDENGLANSEREKAAWQIKENKDDVLYIYVFDATKKLENDEYEKKRFDYALKEAYENNWDFITIGSRADQITEEEKYKIENDVRKQGAKCQIFNLCDESSLSQIEEYINEYLEHRKNTK